MAALLWILEKESFSSAKMKSLWILALVSLAVFVVDAKKVRFVECRVMRDPERVSVLVQ